MPVPDYLSRSSPRPTSPLRSRREAGVPGGSGNTGPFFGLMDWKQLNTFSPLFSGSDVLVLDHLDVGGAVGRSIARCDRRSSS